MASPLKRALIALVAPLLAFAAITWAALEASDIAVLVTRAADGGVRRTRVWFAEHDGAFWMEAPTPERAWLLDVRRSPGVSLERGGVTERFEAEPVTGGRHGRIRALLRAKYGWDWWIGLLQDTSQSVAVRLVPLVPAARAGVAAPSCASAPEREAGHGYGVRISR